MRPASVLSFVASLSAAVAALGLLWAPAWAQGNRWEERAPMLTPRSEHSIAELNGRIYTMGGYSGERIASDLVQSYDSKTDSWEWGPPLPGPMHHTMAASANGHVYIIGGELGGPGGGAAVYLNTTYMLDEEAGTWVPRSDMPTSRSGGAATTIGNKIYVAGGRPPGGHHFAVYDTEANEWTALPDVPTQRNHLAVAAINGKVHVAGGRFGGGVGSEMTAIHEVYDPASNSWSSRAPLLAPRAGVPGVAVNGCLYLIGGEGNDANPRGVFEENEMYDPGTDSWQSLPPLPTPQHGLASLAVIGNAIYVPGGATTRGVSGQNVTLKLQVFQTEHVCAPGPA